MMENINGNMKNNNKIKCDLMTNYESVKCPCLDYKGHELFKGHDWIRKHWVGIVLFICYSVILFFAVRVDW